VSPVSQFDDNLRRRALRAIYGYSALGKYAIDPARPIRIIVENGHISLYGAVGQPDGQADGRYARQPVAGRLQRPEQPGGRNSFKQGM